MSRVFCGLKPSHCGDDGVEGKDDVTVRAALAADFELQQVGDGGVAEGELIALVAFFVEGVTEAVEASAAHLGVLASEGAESEWLVYGHLLHAVQHREVFGREAAVSLVVRLCGHSVLLLIPFRLTSSIERHQTSVILIPRCTAASDGHLACLRQRFLAAVRARTARG